MPAKICQRFENLLSLSTECLFWGTFVLELNWLENETYGSAKRRGSIDGSGGMEKIRSFRRKDDTVYAEVFVDQDLQMVSDVWTGDFGKQEDFIEVVDHVADLIVKHGMVRWLADLRQMQGSFDPSLDYLTNNLMPRVLSAGLKREAVVLPKDAFAKLSVSSAFLQIRDFRLQHFQDYDAARVWLRRSYGTGTG